MALHQRRSIRLVRLILGLSNIIQLCLVKCINWLLSLPPYEALLMSISRVLEKLASILHIEDSFKQILDFLPYVELTTDHGAEMEEAALGLIRCCTQLLNNKPSDQLVASLEALLNRPIYALNEVSLYKH